MAQIFVTSDPESSTRRGTVTLRERITADDLRSPHFCNRLVDRLAWAVGDAHVEQHEPVADEKPTRLHRPGQDHARAGFHAP